MAAPMSCSPNLSILPSQSPSRRLSAMAGRGSMPTVRWDPQVEAYFSASFGPSRLAAMSSALARPSLRPAIRVNTLRTTPEEVVRQLRELLPPGADPRVHPRVPGVVVLRGHGPRHVDYPPGMAEVVINRFAGEAVLKGANVYAPGLLAASPGIAPGDRVAVSVALERPQPARRRGGQAAGRQQQHQEEEEEQQQHGDAMGVPADGDLDGSVGSLEDEAGKPAGASGSISDSDCSTDGFSTRGSTSTSSSGGQGTAKKKRGGGGSGGARWVVGINRGSVVERDGSVRLVGVGPARGGRRKDTSHHHALHGSARAGSTSISSTVTSSTRSSASASAPPAADGVDDAREALDGDGGGAVAVSRRSDRVYAGVAVAAAGRRALFRQEQGLALQMEERVFDVPSCNGLLRGQMMLQALPSIVAAQVLSPPPGSTVLDMCAAPGGKSTLLAQLMGDRGHVVALDRTAAKVQEIQSLARDLGLTCVEAHKADSVEAVTGPGAAAAAAAAAPAGQAQVQGAASGELGSGPVGPPPYPPGSFSHVLLDPPCSALGLRPRLLHSWTLPQLRALAAYQRALLHTAVALLDAGGTLVYCTCTVNPDENEGNVAWALDRFRGQLQLVPAEPRVGSPGLTGCDPHTGQRWLTEAEAALVQRFDPGWLPQASRSSGVGGLGGLLSVSLAAEEEGQVEEDDDCMGFFVARFEKVV